MPTILLVGCSIRARADLDTLGGGCNTEIALDAVRNGVMELKPEIKYLRLNRYFLPNGSIQNIDIPIKEIQKADGIVFASPCYFGLPSSLFQELIEEMARRKIDLYPKVVGFVAVGAKRNGGEETQIVWSAWKLMELGAIIVNDGAPISQFGGVGVAGTMGQMKYDREGLEVCKYLGRRVIETVMILNVGNLENKPNIQNWLMSKSSFKGIGIWKYNFHRCLGHEVCPDPNCKDDYKCLDRADDMPKLHQELVGSDGIIPIGWNPKFMERTRYLRRDNYRLTYSVIYIPSWEYIPFFIKENSILCRKHFEEYCKLISSGRKKIKTSIPIYQPIGYKI